MNVSTLLNARVNQVKWQIEKSWLSEDLTITFQSGEEVELKGIHTWGAVEGDIGANPKRKIQKHWLKICSYSLPEELRSIASLSGAKVSLGSKKYRILDISETFAEFNVTMQPI